MTPTDSGERCVIIYDSGVIVHAVPPFKIYENGVLVEVLPPITRTELSDELVIVEVAEEQNRYQLRNEGLT